MSDSVPVFSLPDGSIRSLGRDTDLNIRLWDRIISTIPIAPRFFQGQTPQKSPDIRRFYHASFLSQRQRGYCFPAGTMVVMADGSEKPIEKIQFGDTVISHTGIPRKVVNIFKRNFTGEMVTFKVTGLDTLITLTDTHPVKVVKNISPHYRAYRPGNLSSKEAGFLEVGDRVVLSYGVNGNQGVVLDVADFLRAAGRSYKLWPNDMISVDHQNALPINRHIPVDSDFGRLIGVYLAEGGVDRRTCNRNLFSAAVWSFGSHEELLSKEVQCLIHKIFGVEFPIKPGEPHPTSIQIDCGNATFATFLKQLISGDVYSKRVPHVFFSAPELVRLALLRGWMDGDGGHKKIKKGFSFEATGTSVCEGLRRDIFRIALSCKLKPGSYDKEGTPGVRRDYGRITFYGKDALKIYPEKATECATLGLAENRGTRYVRWDHGFLCKVKSITKKQVENLLVYNFETEIDHSYVASLICFSNCVGFNTCGTLMTRLRIPQGATATSGTILPLVQLSPLYTYDVARWSCTESGFNMGSGDGLITSEAFKGAKKRGCVELEHYASGPRDIDNHRNGTKPPQTALTEGHEHLVSEFAIADSFEHGLELMSTGFPITVGSMIPDGMMKTDAKGFFRMKGSIIGGHAYQFIDYDKDQNLAWICQAWENWGEKTSDPHFSSMHGFTQMGTCPLDELASWFTDRKMSNGESEIMVCNTIEGFSPLIVDYSSM